MSDFIRRTDVIALDHLAFTVGLSDFRHLERAGGKKSRYNWPRLPLQNFSKYKDPYARSEAVENWQAEFRHICFERFKAWMEQVLNCRLSEARVNKTSYVGLNFYERSFHILDTKSDAKLGLVGFGGNNDTIYVQFSGTGCGHIFSKGFRPFQMHFWLSKVLGVQRLTRCDLCYDDFEGNFDCAYALKAYDDDAFKSANGGRRPLIDERTPRIGRQVQSHTVYVGSRTSKYFWRIYDKAAQQGVDQIWYRTEVELKKVTVDVLENPALFFASINAFANSINLEAVPSPLFTKRKAVLDLAARTRWLKRQCGRTLHDLVEVFEGDIAKAFGVLCADSGGRLGIPDTQADLIRQLDIEEQELWH